MRVNGANKTRRPERAHASFGAAQHEDEALGRRRLGRRRETHKPARFVSWPNTSGMMPLILLSCKYLRMWKERAVSERSTAQGG